MLKRDNLWQIPVYGVVVLAVAAVLYFSSSHDGRAQSVCPTGYSLVSNSGASGCGAGQGTYSLPARNVNFAATGDQATVSVPAFITAYQISSVQITNCSATPILAQPAVYTGAGGTGNNIVAAAVVTAATASGIVINSALATTNTQSAGTLYVRLGVANAAALTCNVLITIKDFS